MPNLSQGKGFTVKVEAARRLAVAKQHLSGELPRGAGRDDIVSLIRDLPFVQWDPVPIVAPSHIISLWNRLGEFRPSDLDSLLWKERKAFLHWTPIAFIVLTEDYPLYSSLMRRYPESLTKSWANHIPRAKMFLARHSALRRRILKELEGGPLASTQFRDYARPEKSAGWSSGSDVSTMLYHMHMRGEVMVAGHSGNQNLWALTGDFLPSWAHREAMSEPEFEREAAQRAIRGLGTATPREITYYFVPGRYEKLKKTLTDLEGESLVHRVTVEGFGDRDERYVHDRDVPLLEELSAGGREPRVSLIPPFDNLLRGISKKVFGFEYVREQFLPKEKRRYGTYVLPILFGERLIGRIDPQMDRRSGSLIVSSVHSEPGAPADRETGSKIDEKIRSLAAFLGAKDVQYTARVPEGWRGVLR